MLAISASNIEVVPVILTKGGEFASQPLCGVSRRFLRRNDKQNAFANENSRNIYETQTLELVKSVSFVISFQNKPRAL